MSSSRGLTAAALCLGLALAGCGSAVEAPRTATAASSCQPESWGKNDPFFADWRQVVDMANPRYVLDPEATAVGKEATYPPAPGDTPGAAPAVKPAPRLVWATDVVTGQRAQPVIDLDTRELAAYDWARTHDARVAVARAGENQQAIDDPFSPIFMLVVPRTDPPFFVGLCATRDYEQPMKAVLGSRYESTLRAVLAGPVSVPEAPTASPSMVGLTAGDVGPEVLDKLNLVQFRVDLPETWSAEAKQLGDEYSIGTRVAQGWNDFITLTWSPADGLSTISAWIPDTGPVEWWVVRNEDAGQKVRLVATMDAVAMTKRQPERDRGTLTVSFSADRPLAELLAGKGTVRLSARP